MVDLEGDYLLPGFIDVHTHGIGGVDAMDSQDKVCKMNQLYVTKGVTSYLPTVLTNSIDKLNKSLSIISYVKSKQVKDEAEIIGVHLEGPFFNPIFKGAQNGKYIVRGTIDGFKQIEKGNEGLVKIISLAPECCDRELIPYLVAKDIIVSAGHTDCSCNELKMAKLEGLSHGTHVYNAMRGLHHREAGVLGAIMLLPDIYAELILDGIHVSADSARILCDIKGYKRINLITDSMRAAGLDDGVYDLGGQDVTVIGNEARLASGALAGSLLTMDIGFKNAINMLGVTVVQAANMSSTNQAGELNLIDRGVIDVDKLADLIIMDKDYNIKSVYKAGLKAC